ncbi:MAG TPA: rhodanese-like domain-containing protein [Lacunisphaera sp.]|nr:rhodanese-like domain-containing protein [Lacunisphaera sp.]
MKPLFLVLLAAATTAFAADVKKIAPAEAARLVANGSAVLIDVREPAEWAATGVVAGAVLLPKSDFDGARKQWQEFLTRAGGKQLILYCRTGHRAGLVAAKLAGEGHQVANAGGFKDWQDAGQPVAKVKDAP